jgi:hypothetical protein
MSSPAGANRSPTYRRPFTVQEDAALVGLIDGATEAISWERVAGHIPGRTARQCRERWIGYLSPTIRVEPWTDAEDQQLLDEVAMFGHQWTVIADHFHQRSGNDVKNRWYTHLRSIALLRPDGRYQLPRGPDGRVLTQQKKRNRALVVPYDAAVDHAARSGALPSIMHLPIPPTSAALFPSQEMELPPLLPPPARRRNCS